MNFVACGPFLPTFYGWHSFFVCWELQMKSNPNSLYWVSLALFIHNPCQEFSFQLSHHFRNCFWFLTSTMHSYDYIMWLKIGKNLDTKWYTSSVRLYARLKRRVNKCFVDIFYYGGWVTQFEALDMNENT